MNTPTDTAEELICIRCARERKTCCQTSEVFVTKGDVRRIEAHSGRTDFHHFQYPEDPVYLDQSDDPTWERHVFREDGTRRILRRRPDGDCTFLGEAGCALPEDVRPLVCRLYPYLYNDQGLDGVSTGCPSHLLRRDQTILDALDISLARAQAWHRELYTELRQEGADSETDSCE